MKHFYIAPKELFVALFIAITFSAFIYLSHFELEYKLLNTILGLFAIFLLIGSKSKTAIYSGFLTGVLWFWWIALSFRYYELEWMIPFVAVAVGLIYALLFTPIGLLKNSFLRALFIFLIYYIAPFGFNWFIPELIFIDSYFGIERWQFALILITTASLHHFKSSHKRFIALLLLIPVINFNDHVAQMPNIDIYIANTDIDQAKKWKTEYRKEIVVNAVKQIDYAISLKKEFIVLPENAFVTFLNMEDELIDELTKRSKKIDIITGALYYENGENYNASYHFSNGKMKVAKKMVLVPFGEYVPFPKFMRLWINELFFNGAKDYQSANMPTDFMVKNRPFRSAICYEATSRELFADNPQFMVALSNNAWFTPSTEPTLQKLLMRYYAKKHGTTIIHAVNGSPSTIIAPY